MPSLLGRQSVPVVALCSVAASAHVSTPAPTLFADTLTGPPPPPVAAVGEQGDISYFGISARSIFNAPAQTGMPYWSVNPYVGCAFGCAYCYARYAHRYVWERMGAAAGAADDEGGAGGTAGGDAADDLPPWLAFERRILVKRNAPDRARAALGRGRARHGGLLRGEGLIIGTATDPYQPAERRFRVTRGILESLAEHAGLRLAIITKSPLVTRDIDVLSRIARRSRVTIHLSLITLDRDLARRLEPRAPTPEARLRALARLREAGLDVGINIMPILPGITDQPSGLAALIRRVAELGATHVNAGALRLQSEARKRYLPFIEAEFPHLAARYRAAYATDSDIGARYREGLALAVRQLCARHGLGSSRYEREPTNAGTALPNDGAGGEQLAIWDGALSRPKKGEPLKGER
jgi:DNA repair photolyase